ncbi:hypothetical protein ACET3X_009761 [Alternaria dauci]|uniref:Uncharacterized protein n=1 Tax=Alternaria dauci TaxID=48095 RepID=A0ABR3U6R1_9PLEO
MVPIPVDNNLVAETGLKSKPDSGYWTNANIALTAVFALIFLAICLALLAFWLHRRNEKKKLDSRKSDTAGLLANEDRTSMFSRVRASSVTLYVDSETEARNKRSSTETTNLVPLQVTPVEEARDPISNNAESSGTGVSSISRTSHATLSTVVLSPMLSPVLSPTPSSGDGGDLGVRPSGRARSTSTASQRARYYESTPTNVEMPPIPKIVHSVSD